jgi:micrococcal nuclease
MRALALLLALLLVAPAWAEPLRVIDGDTLALGGERIRIIGLDAPERPGRCAREAMLGQRAAERLAALLADGARVERRGRDRRRRTLAIVRTADGRDVAQVLIAEGLARPYRGRGPRPGWCP